MVRALLTGLLVLGGTAAAQAQGGATAFFSETVKDFGATIDPSVVGATVVPGIASGTSGTLNGFEGFGISQFSGKKDAALAMLHGAFGLGPGLSLENLLLALGLGRM